MARSYAAVIFDLDGTLADTLGAIARAVNHSLAGMDLPEFPEDSFRTMVGDGIYALCERALPPDQLHRQDELLARLRRRYTEHLMDGSRLYDGIEGLLQDLHKDAVLLAVLSNKPHPLTLGTLEGFGIQSLFAAVLGECPEIPRKPDPAGVHWLLERLGVPAEKTLYVGDTPTDMQTAKAAGLDAVGVLWGFRSAEELHREGALYLVQQPSEIRSIAAGGAGA